MAAVIKQEPVVSMPESLEPWSIFRIWYRLSFVSAKMSSTCLPVTQLVLKPYEGISVQVLISIGVGLSVNFLAWLNTMSSCKTQGLFLVISSGSLPPTRSSCSLTAGNSIQVLTSNSKHLLQSSPTLGLTQICFLTNFSCLFCTCVWFPSI